MNYIIENNISNNFNELNNSELLNNSSEINNFNNFNELNNSELLNNSGGLNNFNENLNILETSNSIYSAYGLSFSASCESNNLELSDIFLKKKKLIEIVKNLSNLEYLEIFNIFKEDNCQYSENSNGIFINLQNINEKTVDKIFNFINYIKQKKEELVKYEELIDNAKKNIGNVKKEISNNVINLKKEKYIDYNYYDNDKDEDDNINSENTVNISNELIISSDEDEDIENKISLKKKKIKYVGKKAKIIKSIKDNQDNKNKLKK